MAAHLISLVFIMLVVGVAGGVINYYHAWLEANDRKRFAVALHHVGCADDFSGAIYSLDIWQYFDRRQRG